MISREKIAQAASDVANHLQLPEQIKALQTAQKELSDDLRSLFDRVTEIEVNVKVLTREMAAEFRALKAEVKHEALKETQSIVNSVQGGFYQRLEAMSNKLAVLDALVSDGGGPRRKGTPPALTDDT